MTDANLHYEGSITVDVALLEASNIIEYEKVQVLNLNNGQRIETYAIEGERDSGTICLNGAAARRAYPGDKVIIISYCHVEEGKAKNWKPKIIVVDEANRQRKAVYSGR